jgi:chloramphenicol 3-O phosphotransferase
MTMGGHLSPGSRATWDRRNVLEYNSMPSLPQVIVLNGTSSSGKTSIAKALQERLLPKLYLNFSIDSILYALPGSVLYRMTHGQDLSDIDYRALVKSYYRSAQALAQSGQSLILDDAVTEAEMAALLTERLTAFHPVIIGVHCGLQELERREVGRGDRTLGEAKGQFDVVHCFLKYDLKVDTTNSEPEKIASQILSHLTRPESLD